MAVAALGDGFSALPQAVGDAAPSSTSSAMTSCAGRVAQREWRPAAGRPCPSLGTALDRSTQRGGSRAPLLRSRGPRPASPSERDANRGHSYRIADVCTLDACSSGSALRCSTPVLPPTSAASVNGRRSGWRHQPRTTAGFAGGLFVPSAVEGAPRSTLPDLSGQWTCDAADVGV